MFYGRNFTRFSIGIWMRRQYLIFMFRWASPLSMYNLYFHVNDVNRSIPYWPRHKATLFVSSITHLKPLVFFSCPSEHTNYATLALVCVWLNSLVQNTSLWLFWNGFLNGMQMKLIILHRKHEHAIFLQGAWHSGFYFLQVHNCNELFCLKAAVHVLCKKPLYVEASPKKQNNSLFFI